MRLSALKKIFHFDPEDRITSLAALFCASLLVGLAIRILWVAVDGHVDYPAPVVTQQP